MMKKNNFMEAMMKSDLPKSMYSQEEIIKKEIVVLEKLKKFIPPLAPDERKQLEQNIFQFGCKDALIIWETTELIAEISINEKQVFVLLDGHNRYEICQKYSIDFRVNIVEIPTFEKAQDFMIDHQLGRRNLSVEQMAYLRGMKYLALKQEKENLEQNRDSSGKFKTDAKLEINHGGQNDHNGKKGQNESVNSGGGQNDHDGKKEKLSEQLAKEFNVGEKTIRRDAEFAKGLDLLPIVLKNEVLQGKSSLKKSDIIELGKIKDIEVVSTKIEQLISGSENEEKSSESKKIKPKEKLIVLLKSYLETPDDCDKLISEIKFLKKELLKLKSE